MSNLNNLIDPASGWRLDRATGINDAGQIVGEGLFNGDLHVFLLVPEPPTVILATCGMAVLVFTMRRRRRIPPRQGLAVQGNPVSTVLG